MSKSPTPADREDVARLIALAGLGTTNGEPRARPNDKWVQDEWDRRILECSPEAVEQRCFALADQILARIASTPKLTDDAAVERAAMTERELAEQAYGPGYEEYRNKWIGDHEEMCADLVRWFIPRPALAAALAAPEETTNVE